MTWEEQQRIEALEQRVAYLESLLNLPSAAISSKSSPQTPSPNQRPIPEPRPLAPEAQPPAPQPRSSSFEAAFGLTWISRIGVITVVLAMAFFFEYALERRWIVAWGRITLGWACGAAGLFFGERFWRSGQRTFAEALTAAGVAFLYLSFWAGFELYQVIVQPAAFALLFLTAILAGALALRYDGAAIAAMALISGYAAPFLLGMRPQPWSVLAYSVAIAALGLVVADRCAWSSTAGVAFLGFWGAYEAWVTPSRPPLLTFLLLSAAFLLFLAWPVWQTTRRSRILRLPDLAIVSLNAAFYFGFAYFLFPPQYRFLEGAFAVTVAITQMMAARSIRPFDSRASRLAAAIAWTLLVLAVPIQFVGYRITLGWALEGAAMAWIGVRLTDARLLHASAAVFILVLARLASLDSRMYSNGTAYPLIANARLLSFAVSAAALWAAAWWTRQTRPKSFSGFPVFAYVAGHGVFLSGLCLEAAGWAARTAAPQNLRSVASTAISVLIAAYAVLLVGAGVFQRSAPTRLLGMVFIGLVVLKLYLYDVWFLAQFYRMAAFAILGVLLLLMSYFYSRFRDSLEDWWRS